MKHKSITLACIVLTLTSLAWQTSSAKGNQVSTPVQKALQFGLQLETLDQAIEASNDQKIVELFPYFHKEFSEWVARSKVPQSLKKKIVSGMKDLSKYPAAQAQTTMILSTLLEISKKQIPDEDKLETCTIALNHFFDDLTDLADQEKMSKISVKIKIALHDFYSGVKEFVQKKYETRFARFVRRVKPHIRENIRWLAPSAILIALAAYSTMRSQASARMPAAIEDPELVKPTHLSDIILPAEVRLEVKDAIDLLKDPESFVKYGIEESPGILLSGKPGVGKTQIAKAIAYETKRPFIRISGSDFIEKYVGVGAARMRAIFEVARKYPRTIIFIDELDAIGGKRSEDGKGGDREYTQTLNQLLTELSDEKNKDVLVIGATNRKDMLDPALIRPGRFRVIHVRLPGLQERVEILKLYLTQKEFTMKNIDQKKELLQRIAIQTNGMTGANLKELVNDARFAARRRKDEEITEQALEEGAKRSLERRVERDTEQASDFAHTLKLSEMMLNEGEEATLRTEMATFTKYKSCRKILMTFQPGINVGKIAYAVANDLKARFYRFDAEDGTGFKTILTEARHNKPAVLLIDDIHLVGRIRGGLSLKKLQHELAKLESEEDIFVIAATLDRGEVAQEILNQFYSHISLDKPDHKTRTKIWQSLIEQLEKKKIKMHGNVNVDDWISKTNGYTFIEIERLFLTAEIKAIDRAGKGQEVVITNEDIRNADDTIKLSGRGTLHRTMYL